MPRERHAPVLYDPVAEAAKPQWCRSGGAEPTVEPVASSQRERKAPAAYDPAVVAAQPQWRHKPAAADSPDQARRRWPFLSNVVKKTRGGKIRKKRLVPQSPVKTFEFEDEDSFTTPGAKKRPKKLLPEYRNKAAVQGHFWKLVEPADAMSVAGRQEAEAHVLMYLQRFRCPDQDGGQTMCQNEEHIMLGLHRVVFAEVDHFKECCLGLRQFIKAIGTRAFKGMREDKLAYDLAPIVRHLQQRWNDGALHSMSEPADVTREVEALADACKAAGFSRSLGFASKTLNFLGLPVPLFSSEKSAVFLGLPKGLSSYGRFLDAWTTEYAKVRCQYEAAAARHIRGVKQGKFIVVSRSCMERRLGAAWFGIRGFDEFIQRFGGLAAAAAKSP
jgi:hypothetical protein